MRTSAIWISSLLLTAAAACGGGGGDDGATPDSGPPDVVSVECAGATIAATVTTGVRTYNPPATTINAGEVVEFDPDTGHDVSTTQGFHVDFAGDACFRFD